MVSIPDGLEPWEDRNDLCKLTNSILRSMPGKLEDLIETIIKEDTNKVTCIIADGCMGWATRVAKKMGIRSAVFWPASVCTLASVLSFQKLIDDGIINNNEAFFQVVKESVEASRLTEWFICNSTTELEPGAFTMYPQVLPIGPLLASNRLADQAGHFWKEDSTSLEWLNQQPACSVIYIAFGSFTIFNQTQFQELALGLELSNRPFLWVVRPGFTKETTAAYPDGYLERVGSRGRIVSWAPQQKVLAHSSVACFNGLGFNKDETGIITREEIKSKVEQLLGDNTFRAKAMDIKVMVASSIRKGGCSHKNLTNFIEWIQYISTNAEKADAHTKTLTVDTM
ncbi:hypothetical protein L2E82_44137 [Cichorium intybus]|uniref:Uncharacterized protein n=1 Tax=Cichorium intybus TaxID=13427 RepID=A0ACB8ZPR5_CICIN|nr:hypothetical protein L2E82_44137 [Cichorium intybus]